eukprot:CAMPEP_0170815760 /NCGR_PEP_ID=MMETSP0733-20121128/38709_1 /TAXON_ID=186038 /ORGANISM="Fragilariopsis kerguelensis, Strain L26-C5" /LENGTH=402 /DNA_ID=CAMNT_0011174497 /DNA_START=16 /DNA_END=1224 /DNA_ORIENTATION=-
MTFASKFERDCPPRSDGIVDTRSGSIVVESFNRYKLEAPFKNNIQDERIISFSSKSELDAELKSIFDDSDRDKDELKIVRHLTNPPEIPEHCFETPETTSGERNWSITDILSDLTSSQSKQAQECFDFDNSSIFGHSNKCRLDIMSHNGEMEATSNASSSDIFQFKKEEEWTAFIPLLPTHALDKNGFPTSCGAEKLNDDGEIVNNIEMKTEFLESQSAPAKDIKEKDTKPPKDISLHANKKRERCDNNTEKTIGKKEVEQFILEEYNHQQEDFRYQVGRKLGMLQNTRNKSNGRKKKEKMHESVDDGTRNQAGQSSSNFLQDKTSSASSEEVNRSVGFSMSSIENSNKLESPSSPSSVTDFGHNLVATPNTHLSGTFPISRPKPVWNPKPPEHYNHHSCEI